MKNVLSILLLLTLFSAGFSQNSRLVFKKEKLKEASFICEITPELWNNLGLPFEDRTELDRRRRRDFSQDWYVYVCPQEYNYGKIVEYVSVEISAICNGKTLTSRGVGDVLTADQKNILNAADLNTDIGIRIRFRFRYKDNDSEDENRIMEGELAVQVVPDTEAEFQSGFLGIPEYLTECVVSCIPQSTCGARQSGREKIQNAVVEFTVDEIGRVGEAKVSRTSTDKKIDELLLDAISKMPRWKPAQNSEGVRVRQEFSIALGRGGC